jgi:hypothetical protein
MTRTFLGAVAALICACGGSDSSTITPAGQDGADVSGTWSLTWTSQSGGTGQGTMQLAQNGAVVTGTAVATGSPCFANVDVSGSIAGDTLTATLIAGGESATIDTTVTGSQMSGSYRVTAAGACADDMGSIIATR